MPMLKDAPCREISYTVQTFDGIDTCGKRLAAELKETIRDTPSLKYISVFGHSMGGLIARHALGSILSNKLLYAQIADCSNRSTFCTLACLSETQS